MNRAEHLAWCKGRANEYLEKGDITQAVASMLSDLSKHEETADHPAIEMGAILLLGGNLGTVQAARDYNEGFI